MLHYFERILTRWRRFGAAAAVFGLTSLGGIWLAHNRALRANQRAAQEAAMRQRIETQELLTRQTLYAADMNLAQQAIVAGKFGRAEELLAAYWPTDGHSDLRGFEWFHYWDRVRGDTLGVLRGHEQVVTGLALSRDGRRLYSTSFDGTLREWSLETLREQRAWSWPGSLLLALAWDPTGQQFGVALNKRTINLWRCARCRPVSLCSSRRLVANVSPWGPPPSWAVSVPMAAR